MDKADASLDALLVKPEASICDHSPFQKGMSSPQTTFRLVDELYPRSR